jgi:hypothetical protein
MDKKMVSDKHYKNAFSVVLSEILFNVLPLIILTIVFAYQHKAYSLFYASEWSLTSAILFGQSITKIVSAFVSTRTPAHTQRVVATITVLIVLGLAPALAVFILLLIASNPPMGLLITQMVMFLVSLIVFVVIGSASELIIAEGHDRNKSG